MLVARQLHQHFAMADGQLGKIVGLCADARLSSGASAACSRQDQRLRAIEFLVAQPGSRLGAMQRGDLAAPELCEFIAKTRKIARRARCLPACGRVPRNSASSSVSTASLQCARRAAEPAQRMLQQRQQGRRLEPVCRRLRREPRENASRRVHQRVAAGIVEGEIPAAERRDHAPRQRTIRRHQRRGFVRDAAPRASPPRSPAPPSRDCRLR